MSKNDLHSLLEKLHAELDQMKSVDAESRARLQHLIDEVERIANQDSANDDSADDDVPESPVDQIEDTALKFEAEYPKISMVLGEIADALGKLGI